MSVPEILWLVVVELAAELLLHDEMLAPPVGLGPILAAGGVVETDLEKYIKVVSLNICDCM